MKTDFVTCLALAQEVFEQYKEAHPKWWGRMDGTPILNDVAVLMAEKFNNHIYGLENCADLNNDLLKKLLTRAADVLEVYLSTAAGGTRHPFIAELRKGAE